MNNKIKFITFEGIDGTGKSTQINLLKEYLVSQGYSVVVTREPGGNKAAEKIRDIVLNESFIPESELMLFQAARVEHLDKVIIPAIKNGSIVLCDRFLDSTIAYQGRYIHEEDIRQIHKITTNRFCKEGFLPDLTFLLTLDPNESAKRILSRTESNIYDNQELSEFIKIQQNFLNLAAKEPSRVKIIPTNGTVEETFGKIKDVIINTLF